MACAAPSRRAADGRSLNLYELNEERSVDHDLVAGFEARCNFIAIFRAVPQGYVLPREAAIGLGDIDVWQVLIVTQNRRDRSQ